MRSSDWQTMNTAPLNPYGEAQERRIWEEAVRLSLGTIPDGLRNALEQVRKGVEG